MANGQLPPGFELEQSAQLPAGVNVEPVEEAAQQIKAEGLSFPPQPSDIRLPGSGITIPGSFIESVTGIARIGARPELGELPEFGTTEKGDTASIAAGLLTTFEPRDQLAIIQQNVPEAEFETLSDGTTVISVPDEQGNIQRSVLNRPGLSPQDVTTTTAQALAFLPTSRLASLGTGILSKLGLGAAGAGATEALRQEAAVAQGAEEARDPTQIALAAGLGGAGEIVAPIGQRIRDFIRAAPEGEAAQVIAAGERAGIPVLTTDVIPPETFLGRSIQQLGEKIGPLGTGGARRAQQAARQEAVINLADEFGIENVSDDFLPQIVESLSTTQARNLQRAAATRGAVIDRLNPLGEVQTNNTRRAIDRQITRIRGLRDDPQNRATIAQLEATRDNLGGNFENVQNLRTEVIADVRAARRADDPRFEQDWQAVKSAMDRDMVIFARRAQRPLEDRTIVRDWVRSNREFSAELGKGRDAVLKNILNTGEAKPSQVATVLRSGDPTQLNRLNRALSERGRAAARGAIIKDALETSGFFTSANPDRLATALNKPKTRKSIDAFFNAQDRRQLEGFTRLLDSTRRAQAAAVSTPTGQQLVPLAIGGGAIADPLTTFLSAGTLAAATRGYESRFVRNALLKLAASRAGSRQESQLLRQLQPIATGALQAARQSQGGQQ
jgi:hypothetical protein